jgi:hypothetical protein
MNLLPCTLHLGVASSSNIYCGQYPLVYSASNPKIPIFINQIVIILTLMLYLFIADQIVCLFYCQAQRLYFFVDLYIVPDLSRRWFVFNILVFLIIIKLFYIPVTYDNLPLLNRQKFRYVLECIP